MYSSQPETGSSGRVLRNGSLFTTLIQEWKILLGLVVLGVLVGAALALTGPERFTATTSVYTGQTMDSGGTPVSGVDSDARAISQLLASDEVLGEAARRTGMGMTSDALGRKATITTGGILVIGVTDEDARRAAAAADSLAEVLLEHISGRVDEKILALERQLASDRAALAESEARSRSAQAGLQALAGRGGGEQHGAASYLSIIHAASAEQQALRTASQKADLVLLAARQTERARVLHPAGVPTDPDRSSMSVNVAAGALVGLLAALVLILAKRALPVPRR
jgi:capsular polysaccharide biosynthesis protein